MYMYRHVLAHGLPFAIPCYGIFERWLVALVSPTYFPVDRDHLRPAVIQDVESSLSAVAATARALCARADLSLRKTICRASKMRW